MNEDPRLRDGLPARASPSGLAAAAAESGVYAALDLGTNNCRLLIACPAGDGFRVVDSFSRIIRLGEGISATGSISEAAIDRALMDQNLLGAALGDGVSWSAWLAVLRAAFALPMSHEDRAAFAKVAGDRDPPSQAVSELWAVCGRRSGKTRVAAAVSVYIGAIKQHHLAPGEVGFVLLLAATWATRGR
jgi:hypothetical protein